MKLTKEQLLEKLKECANMDTESRHVEADNALLDYIDDEKVRKAFDELSKWYA